MFCSIMKLLFTLSAAMMVFCNVYSCEGHRILGIFPLNSHSHFMMFKALMQGLARRGHQVDVVSVFPQKTPYPNYTDITIGSTIPKLINNLSYDYALSVDRDFMHFVSHNLGNAVCAQGLENPQIQRIIENPPKNPPYDLVILEAMSAHCFMAFGYHLNVPVIGVSSATLYPWLNDMIANPENLAFIPNNLLEYTEITNFWQRVNNVVYTFYQKWLFNKYTSSQDQLIRKHFGPNTPGVRELERNIALVLTNSHKALNGPMPITPALVEVGGLHIQDDGPDIPAEYKTWLDESTNGFIYFTFGSMITIESMSKPVLDVLFKSLGKIAPVRVLMKIPRPELLPPGLPSNIRTFSWMPQIKVLKHKNIRAFITHGGLMSTQEAIACAVPLIGIPLFADQFVNIDLYVKKKIAVKLNHLDLREDQLDAALNEILHNPVYKNAMKEVSSRFLDQPLSPMDTAGFWVEYVIRHGSKALRSPAMNLTWWQIALLDVYAFLLFIGILTIVTAIIAMRILINMIFHTPIVESAKKFE